MRSLMRFFFVSCVVGLVASSAALAIPAHLGRAAVSGVSRQDGTDGWVPAPQGAAELLNFVAGKRLSDPTALSEAIAGERRVCSHRAGVSRCWDPAGASPRERRAVTELACRLLRVRQDEIEEDLQRAHPPANPVDGSLSPELNEALLKARDGFGAVLRDGGVPYGELEASFRDSLAGAFPGHAWTAEAASELDGARQALASFPGPRLTAAFQDVRRLLGEAARRQALPTSEQFELEHRSRFDLLGIANFHALGSLERYVVATTAKDTGSEDPLRTLESELGTHLRRILGEGVHGVAVFVHGRTPVDSNSIWLSLHRRGIPQPYELDRHRFDPDIQVSMENGTRLRFKLEPDGRNGWAFVPQAYRFAWDGREDRIPSVQPFQQLTDRQIACLAGLANAHKMPSPPAAPEGLPTLRAFREQRIKVCPAETSRGEAPFLPTLDTRLRVQLPSAKANRPPRLIPLDEVPLTSFFLPSIAR